MDMKKSASLVLIALLFWAFLPTSGFSQGGRIIIEIEKEEDGQRIVERRVLEPGSFEFPDSMFQGLDNMLEQLEDIDIDVTCNLPDFDKVHWQGQGDVFFGPSFLGIEFENQEDQLVVSSVVEESAADLMGLKVGDKLLKLNNIELTAGNLRPAIHSVLPGNLFSVTIQRGGKEEVLKGRMGRNNAHVQRRRMEIDTLVKARPRIGIMLESADQPTIVKVVPNSTADKIGLKEGDILKSINGTKINGLEDIRSAISEMEAGEEVEVKVERNGKSERLKGEWEAMNFPTGFIMRHGPRKRQMRYHPGKGETRIKIKVYEDEEVIDPASVGELEVDFYPNPNEGQFSYAFDLDNGAEAQVQLLDANGKVLYSKDHSGNGSRIKEEIVLENQAGGVYLLKVSSGGEVVIQKIISK